MSDPIDERQESLRLIRESAAAVVPRDQGPRRARKLRFTSTGFDADAWRAMCELGWVGLRVPESRGGAGLGLAALCAVTEQMGAALAPEPLIAAAAAAPHLPDAWLARVLDGSALVVPAWREALHSLDTGGQSSVRDAHVTGQKPLVAGGVAAQAFLVCTRDGLVLVERGAQGVTVTAVPLHDGGQAGDLVLSAAPGERLPGDFERSLDECAVAQAAYLLGAMEAAFEITLAYIGVRRQFGKPIGSFQSLQHRSVDMKIQIELTRAVVQEAANALDAGRGSLADRQALVSRASMRAADAAMLIAREAVQFHGAMGMTDEGDIGLYARKIFTVCHEWGSSTAHRQRFAALEQARHD